MEIWHRVGFNPRGDVGFREALDEMGIGYEISPLPGYPVGIIYFDIEESDHNWPAVDRLIQTFHASNVYDTTFSAEEIIASEWSRLYLAYQQGYPQPKEDMAWTRLTYENYCSTCGTGFRQVKPFRLDREPRMGKNDFFCLWWASTVFCTPRVIEALKSAPVEGYEVWPAIIHKTGLPSRIVSQLVFPRVTKPGLEESENLKPETCPECGVTKYAYHKRGYMQYRRAALPTHDLDVVETFEWFGSGYREILVSNRFARLVLERGWKGIRFKPIQVI